MAKKEVAYEPSTCVFFLKFHFHFYFLLEQILLLDADSSRQVELFCLCICPKSTNRNEKECKYCTQILNCTIHVVVWRQTVQRRSCIIGFLAFITAGSVSYQYCRASFIVYRGCLFLTQLSYRYRICLVSSLIFARSLFKYFYF